VIEQAQLALAAGSHLEVGCAVDGDAGLLDTRTRDFTGCDPPIPVGRNARATCFPIAAISTGRRLRARESQLPGSELEGAGQ
jgi:hypothetical protein